VQNFFINQGKENRVQICSGIYVLTAKDFRKIDVDHMLDLARIAEKRVHESRKSDFEFYNPEQWEKGKRIADIVNFLPKALQSGNIQVWYQPQVDYVKGKIIGAEALCRWEHDKLGWIGPPDFITTLEEAGLIFELDRFVWDKVCQDLHRWNEQGCHRSVSVNVSRDDIREDRDIPGHFHNLISKYGLFPDQLRIEITETAYVENSDLLISTTERLRELGFQVEMDDFGSGYSSLHMLKEVPVDRIKLDLHFLTATGDSEKCRTIVSCMIGMVRLLGMEMIAEGVETIDQAHFLRDQGCSLMQGYYFYKPMPVQDFEKKMKEGF
jgi:EAL domain-containing protein (putative c-di-GMP-specific phosphodiesterase class I)